MDFDRLLDEVYPGLVRYCRRHEADPTRAENAAQDAFVRFLGVRPRGDAEALGIWLYREATRALLDPSTPVEAQARLRTTVHPNPPRAVPPRGAREALADLAAPDRALLLLREEGFPYRTVGELTGVPVATVGARLAHARRSFLAALTPGTDGGVPAGAEHPAEGDLQAHLDGEAMPEGEGVDAHLSACEGCRQRVAALEVLALGVRRALDGLGEVGEDQERPDVDRARWEIRRRRISEKGPGRGGGVRRRSAARAALVILVACAVAAVIPGSPLRSLFVEAGGAGGSVGGGGPAGPTDPEAAPGTPGASPRTGASLPGMTGVAVGFRDSRVDVVLEGAGEGTQVELVVGVGDRVEVLAPQGTGFRAGTGNVVVELGDHRPGSVPTAANGADVVIRIPPGPGEVLLQSERRFLSRWVAGAFQFGEGVDADPRSDGVRIRVPPAPGPGGSQP